MPQPTSAPTRVPPPVTATTKPTVGSVPTAPATKAKPAASECSAVRPRSTTAGTIVGNRVLPGRTDLLAASPTVVDLPETAQWIVDDPTEPGQWLVMLTTGAIVVVTSDGDVQETDFTVDGPPEAVISESGDLVVGSAYADHGRFADPLPDTRVVGAAVAVALVGPTNRYGHGVLGDRIEASAVEMVDRCSNASTRVEIAAPSVIEGVSAIVADVDGDRRSDVLVTESNADVGAWLAAYNMDGLLIATSDAIGQGNRWRNQLAVAPTGPAGEVEVIDVRVPHIGGVVEFFQYRPDGRLERVATAPGEFTTHVNGSRNVDMGVVMDATGDGQPNVIVPTQARTQIGVLRRTTDAAHPTGVEVVGLIDLSAPVVSNFGTQATSRGPWLAVGTSDQRLHILPPQ